MGVIAVVVARDAAWIFRTRKLADLCAVLVFCIAETNYFLLLIWAGAG
jgi:hypothetical protein